ncbi:MAG: hypothetical protein RLZZ458_2647 [Planctomycetota bacterium]|jgi:hypothetical protein
MLAGSYALLLTALLLSADDFRATQLDGSATQGKLSEINQSSLTINTQDGPSNIPLSNLLLLEATSPESASEPNPQQIWLRNGAELSGTTASQNTREVTLQSPRLGTLAFPTTEVRALRLQPDNPAFRPAWDAFRQRQTEQDLLVVAKRDGTGLDFLAGVVSSTSPEKVDFLLDGETVPVPTARAYGLVFGQTVGKPPRIPAVRLTLAGADLLAGTALTASDTTFKLTFESGKSIEAPLSLIRQADFSGGRLRSLAELEPLDIRFLGIEPEGSPIAGLAEQSEFEQLLWGPRLDGRIPGVSGHTRMRLRGREFARGIALHSAAEITWDLRQQFEQLDCLVGIDDAFAAGNSGQNAAQLVIQIDKRTALDQTIRGSDAPRPVSINLRDVSTLTIKVDYADGSGIGDWIVLGDPRLRIRTLLED